MTTRTPDARPKRPFAVKASTATALAALAALGCLDGPAAAAAAPPASNPVAAAPASGVFDRVAVKRMVIEEARNSLVPPALALALAKVESNFQATALSSSGARGVMQIAPEDARPEFGVDPDELWNPRLNIQLGLDRLGRLYQLYGRWDLALSHYRAGRIEGFGSRARPLPAARGYVEAVLRWRDRYEAQNTVWAALHEREARWPSAADGRGADTGERLDRTTRTAPLGMVAEMDDDFVDIDTRRAIAGPYLDDFSPPVRVARRR